MTTVNISIFKVHPRPMRRKSFWTGLKSADDKPRLRLPLFQLAMISTDMRVESAALWPSRPLQARRGVSAPRVAWTIRCGRYCTPSRAPIPRLLAPSECLGHIARLPADLDAPISRCHLCEGRHASALDFRVHCVCTERSKRVQTRYYGANATSRPIGSPHMTKGDSS
jgi:hypothetical protein